MNEATYEQRKLALIEEITEAFDGVSREGGVSLSESWVIDNYGDAEARAEARRQDSETRWQDVPEEDINNGYSCLSFMDDIGFRYYIPAYIVWFLRHLDDETEFPGFFDSNTFEFLIYALGGGGSGELEEFYLSRYRLFTAEQNKAIAHFLQFDAEVQDVANMEGEEFRQKYMTERGFSQEEIDAAWQRAEQFRQESDRTDNDARSALERYWGQFL